MLELVQLANGCYLFTVNYSLPDGTEFSGQWVFREVDKTEVSGFDRAEHGLYLHFEVR